MERTLPGVMMPFSSASSIYTGKGNLFHNCGDATCRSLQGHTMSEVALMSQLVHEIWKAKHQPTRWRPL